MTDELIRRLIVADLSKQQASSVTAETLVNLFMPDDGKKLILAAKNQVTEMNTIVQEMKAQYLDLKRKMVTFADNTLFCEDNRVTLINSD